MEKREQMLKSINNFLDDTVVLPPGDWDQKTLLSMNDIVDLRRKKQKRSEKLKKQEDESNNKVEPIIKKIEIEKKAKFDPFVRTRVPFGGVFNEFRQRAPHWKSDVTDSFNVVCLAAVAFIFVAALAGAIAFGGLLGELVYFIHEHRRRRVRRVKANFLVGEG